MTAGAVVVAHALVQAVCVAPGLTPAASPAFLGLFAVSAVAFVTAATALVVLVGAVDGRRPRMRRALAAVVVAVIVVGALAIAWPAALIPAVLVALVAASPAGNTEATVLSGFGTFARHPVRAVVLAVVTLLALVVLGLAALLFGFLVTGWMGALATWVLSGAIVALLVRAWARLAVRPSRADGSRPRGSRADPVRPGVVAR